MNWGCPCTPFVHGLHAGGSPTSVWGAPCGSAPQRSRGSSMTAPFLARRLEWHEFPVQWVDRESPPSSRMRRNAARGRREQRKELD